MGACFVREGQAVRNNVDLLGTVLDEVIMPIRDAIEVKSYVGGLVKSFERKAA